jgi:flagellin-specific chaperone FliS
MQKFSQEQLIQYLYGECSPILKLAIEKAMLDDLELNKEIKMLQRTIKQISKLKPQSPSDTTIDAILKYAKETVKKK